MKRFPIYLTVVSLFLVSACAPESPPPPDQEEAVRAVIRSFETTIDEGDLDGWLGLLVEDAVWMPPNGEARIGRQSILNWVQPWFEQFEMRANWEIEGVEASQTWAVAWGTGEFQSTPKGGGESTMEPTKWIVVLQRQSDNSWKFVRRIYNTDLALPE